MIREREIKTKVRKMQRRDTITEVRDRDATEMRKGRLAYLGDIT